MTAKIAIRVALVVLLVGGLAPPASPQPGSPAGTVMHVESISIYGSYSGGGYPLWSAYVLIRDESGAPVNGATVTGDWSGDITKKGASGVTESFTTTSGAVIEGYARITGRKHWWIGGSGSAVFVFTVTSVTKNGMTYDPSANVVTSGSFGS